jgi:hypothetical protein
MKTTDNTNSIVQIPNIFQWIISAPTLLGKLKRVFASAQAKDWTTTAAALLALGVYLASMFGFPIDESTVKACEAAALAIIGFFTGKQVINPQIPLSK